MMQLPAESHAAQMRLRQDRPVAVVPDQAQEPRLARLIVGDCRRKLCERLPRSAGNRFKDIAGCRKAGFNSSIPRMNRSVHDAEYAGDWSGLFADRHDARRGANDIDDVAEANSRADCIPVSVKRADGDRNPGLKTQTLGPL